MLALGEKFVAAFPDREKPILVTGLRTAGSYFAFLLRAYLEAQGFEVLNVDGEPRAAAAGNQGINDQDPESVVEFASRACRPEADALLCSCTAWRSVEAASAIEQRTGRPVVSSNQSTIWTALRALGVTRPIAGFGRLLESLAPARPLSAAG